ncbi:truncated MobA family endonuclease relaxase [Streptococcus pneumoniae]|nr:relaxase [Streptococcus pneumoniae 2061617]EJG74006.1 relaxase [Streptococcus pneumoniae 2082239]MDS2252941.1 conjugative relaxase-related protein [Streptococcus pneumoniae]CKU06114.1 Lantibiotic streptin immunity protein [Mycobacterium tuberculosis]MDS5873307.1 conjugative relaxase-related protein [Streptococcus pneumoniae]
MIELSNTNKQYQEIKDELVLEIAEIDMQLEETQEKIATLNKMAEVLINLKSEDHETRKLAKYDFDQMNMTESIMLDRLNTDILKLQQELGNEINKYEEIARRLDLFVKIINTNKFTVLKFHENALLE